MSGSIKYICQFCSRAAVLGMRIGNVRKDQMEEVHVCKKCDINFVIGPSGTLLQMHMNCRIKGQLYQLQLNYDENKSRILIIPDKVEDTIIMVTDFEGTSWKVTPNNLISKIETYVMFS